MQKARMIFFFAVAFLLLNGKFFGQSRNIQLAMENSRRVNELMEQEGFDKAELLLQKTLELSLPDTLQALIENQYSMILGFKGEFEEAIAHSSTAIALYSKQFGEGNKHTIDVIYNKGELFGGLDNYDSLFFYLEKSLDLYYRYTPEEYADIGLVHNNLATNYRYQDFHRKALFHFKKAVENWEKVAKERPDYLAIGYENLGAYLETDESLVYLQKALDLKIEQGANPFRSYIEMAGKLSSLENFRQALEYYHIGLKLLKPLADNQKEEATFDFQYDLATTYSLVAQAHEGLKQYDSARYYYQAAFDVPSITQRPNLQTRFLTGSANIYRSMGENDKAIDELLGILPRTQNDNDYMFGYVTYSLSKAYAAKQDYRHALLYNLFSLRYDAYGNKSLEPDSIIRVFSRNELSLQSNSGVLLANHALYLKEYAEQNAHREKAILELALKNIEEAVAHFEEVGNVEYSSLFYKRAFDKVMETQQSILLKLFEITNERLFLTQAFAVSERAKINKTLLYFNDQDVRSMAELPEDIFDRDRQLKSKVAEVERNIYRENQKEAIDSASLRTSYNELFQLRREYQVFEAQIREKYPRYFELRHNVEPAGITEIQSELTQGTFAIIYSMHESNLFIYTISRNNIWAKQLQIAESLRSQIEAYRADLLSPTIAPKDLALSAHALYKALIVPALEKSVLPSELLIIPDKEISTIPFETLVTRNEAGNGFSNLPYLLHQSEIHYAYSATLWHKQHSTKNNEASKLWAGFAPNYDPPLQSLRTNQVSTNQETISILPGAEREVEELSELMEGSLFTGENANKETLLQAGKDYKVLHLAMHSTINNDQPMYSSFLFTPNVENDDEQLTVSELFHQELNAELVVLSACNSGYGRLLPGEGVLSLSQAFTAAGCPSTLMSLWMVPDQETTLLMNNFYEGIKAKMSKSEALHVAKINYLNEVVNDKMAHPFYWAGFVLSGNEQAISHPGNYREIITVLGILLLVGGFFFWRKRFT